jgi:membrane protease YdiL (CAAX protease family)
MNQMRATTPARAQSSTSSRPALQFFLVTFGLSWAGALVVAAPRLLRGQPISEVTGLMMFPVMLLGPFCAAALLTLRHDGSKGLASLLRGVANWRVPVRWYAVLLIPPALVLSVLLFLSHTISPVFVPGQFYAGVSFGLVAGFVEEIGWTGFAFPAMLRAHKPLVASVILGVLWSLWHIPVVDSLGAATPHGRFWLLYLVAFAAVMTAIRVLICWTWSNTHSLLLAQLLHASSTGALVVFSPRVGPAAETLWYLVYATALWCVGAIVAMTARLGE